MQRQRVARVQEPFVNVTPIEQTKVSHQGTPWLPLAVVAAAAVVMGLPTLGGTFVGGDDHRLVLNHVLVNHPSFEHAIKLFTLFHRDLYQPLPLLTFQMEFALAGRLGLFDESLAGGAWLFHLTNVLLHALNAVVVWFVIRMLGQRTEFLAPKTEPVLNSRRPSADVTVMATVVALLFAVHPLQTEVVAWTNGRMMLLSTLFGLLALLAFASFIDRPRARMGVLTVVLVVLCAISKVRIGLPILLMVVAVARHAKVQRRMVFLWSACAVATAIFVVVNVRATSGADLFSEAAEHLHGPRPVRVLLALAHYLQHLVWPVGLASYYPTPPTVHWTDPDNLRAAAIVVPVLLGVTWACVRSRVALLGTLWFGATIAATLPFIPARNILAADRYMYLPIIGVLWVCASLGGAVVRRLTYGWSLGSVRTVTGTVAVLLVPAMIGMCWHVAAFYSTPLQKTRRIASLFPDIPRVWERVGWCYYKAEEYEKAIEAAEKDLLHDAPVVKSGAYQLIGMCELRRGNGDEALRLLHEALVLDPDSVVGRTRLARAYNDLGRFAEAVRFYEIAVREAPGRNPTLNRLASLYRQLGRPVDARDLYEQQLRNNPYEVPASMGLAELDMEVGTEASYRAGEARLRTLLEWMPENTSALTNLGAALVALGRSDEAVKVYQTALDFDKRSVTAALNLANLYLRAGKTQDAGQLYELARAGGLISTSEAAAVHDFYVSEGHMDQAVALWRDFTDRYPGSQDGRAFLAWAYVKAGSLDEARAIALSLSGNAERPLMASAALAYVDLVSGNYGSVVERTEAVCASGSESATARRRLLGALERFDHNRPRVSWTYCMVARLLMPDGNREGVEVSIDLCEKRCTDDICRGYVSTLRSRLARMAPAATEPEH